MEFDSNASIIHLKHGALNPLSSRGRQFPMDKPARLGYNKGKILAKERCP